jgi:parallel beta-helix repeat protein
MVVILLNLLLVTTVHASYLRLDRIHPSLPAISLVSLRSTASRFIDDIARGLKDNTPKIAGLLLSGKSEYPKSPSGHENFLVGDTDLSVTPTEKPIVDATNPPIPTATQTPTNIHEEKPTVNPTSVPASTPTSPPNPTSIVAFNTTYYVAPNGDNANPGTEKQPLKTIQKVTDIMVPGDTVVVLSGEYDERVQITTSGSSGAPITYQAEGTVTMKGFTVKADYITIEGFDITDTDNNWQEGWGIFVQGSHCILKNNYVYFATRGGIMLYANGGDDPVTSNCVVKNNRLRRNAMAGIDVQGRNNIIVGNEIWGTIQYHPKWINPPSWVDADGMRFFGRGHTIRKNYIHDITYDDPRNANPHIDCFQTWSDATHKAATDVIFEQNICEVLESQTANESGHGFMLRDASNLIIRNNIIQTYRGVNTGGGGNSHLTIVNNIFANDLSFQFFPGGVVLEDCPNTVVKNNIFYNQPYHTISVTGNRNGQEIDYNLAYRSDGQPSRCYEINYQCVNPAPAHDLWDVDPLFVNPAAGNFHFRGGSPAIDAGISLVEVSNDFDGNLRPQGRRYDIGPYERVK